MCTAFLPNIKLSVCNHSRPCYTCSFASGKTHSQNSHSEEYQGWFAYQDSTTEYLRYRGYQRALVDCGSGTEPESGNLQAILGDERHYWEHRVQPDIKCQGYTSLSETYLSVTEFPAQDSLVILPLLRAIPPTHPSRECFPFLLPADL